MVPEGWLKTTFGAVTEIANGQVDPKVEPYLNMFHIGPENVVSDSGQIVDVVTCKESSLISGKYEFDENAIVYSKIRPNLNKVCRPGFKGVCSADMYPIWAKSELDIEFLLHYMLGPLFYKVAVAMSMRTGMPKINRSDLNTVPLLLPPIDEQKKIAQILSSWDKAIITTEQLLANSQQQKKALMQQLLTGKKRLLDKNGVRFNRNWEKVRIQDLFSPSTEKAGDRPYRVYSVTKEGLIDQVEYFNKVVASEDTSNYRVVRKGQFIMSGLNFWMGSVDVHDSLEPVKVSPAYKVFDILDSADVSFMRHFVRSTIFLRILEGSSIVGASVVRRNFSPDTFNNWVVSLPTFEEQKKIANVLSTADKEISVLQHKLDTLKQEKNALMQQLLTGKRRVKIN